MDLRTLRRGFTLVSTVVAVAQAAPVMAAPPPPSADLSVGMTASPDPVQTGADLKYTVVVTNHGPDTSPNAWVGIGIPDSSTFVSATASVGTCKTVQYYEDLPYVGCDFGALRRNRQATVVMIVRPGASGKVLNTAWSSSGDPNYGNNGAMTATQVTPAPGTQPTPKGRCTGKISGTVNPLVFQCSYLSTGGFPTIEFEATKIATSTVTQYWMSGHMVSDGYGWDTKCQDGYWVNIWCYAASSRRAPSDGTVVTCTLRLREYHEEPQSTWTAEPSGTYKCYDDGAVV